MSKPAPSLTPRKLSKREQLRLERRRRAMKWNIGLIGGAALVVAAIVAYFVINARPGALPGEFTVPDEGRGHVEVGTPITYRNYPPSSGTHYGSGLADWGVSSDSLEEGYFVHNLEHGGVVFLYNCEGDECTPFEQQFEALYAKAPPAQGCPDAKIAAGPYERELPSEIVALAWGRQLNVDSFDEGTLMTWYERFVNRGPEDAC